MMMMMKGNSEGDITAWREKERVRHTSASGSSQALVAFPAVSRRCWVAVEMPLSCHCRLKEDDERIGNMRWCLSCMCSDQAGVCSILPDIPTGTTSWYWLRLEPLKVLEGRGMTGGVVWWESSTTCDKRRLRLHHSSETHCVLHICALINPTKSFERDETVCFNIESLHYLTNSTSMKILGSLGDREELCQRSVSLSRCFTKKRFVTNIKIAIISCPYLERLNCRQTMLQTKCYF